LNELCVDEECEIHFPKDVLDVVSDEINEVQVYKDLEQRNKVEDFSTTSDSETTSDYETMLKPEFSNDSDTSDNTSSVDEILQHNNSPLDIQQPTTDCTRRVEDNCPV